jgi:arylsulfatase A-like enzyme
MGPLTSTEALAEFREDIAKAPRGVAYILHLLQPHHDYLYREDCSLKDPTEWEREHWGDDDLYSDAERGGLYRRYFSQLVCTEARMRELFAHLKRIGVYDEATIVVHGDHGSRIGVREYIPEPGQTLTDEDLFDHHATLLAIKAPGRAPGLRTDRVAIQRAFADIFLGGAAGDRLRPTEVLVRNRGTETFRSYDFPPADKAAPPLTAGTPEVEQKRVLPDSPGAAADGGLNLGLRAAFE